MRIKICGMKYPENILEVGSLLPDYMGFIFWEKSARYFDGIIPELSSSIRKVGVFVNATVEEIIEKI
ncbi:MAG: phosphoribosylanthranilate isomerase, partial [Flavobacterium sp.]|nr:phosphoribosylanthranilate isomerase [Flavobacterium sp.]